MQSKPLSGDKMDFVGPHRTKALYYYTGAIYSAMIDWITYMFLHPYPEESATQFVTDHSCTLNHNLTHHQSEIALSFQF